MLRKISGEFIFIILFCTAYALIANIESRLFPTPGSLAYRQRTLIYDKIGAVNRQEEKSLCEQQALKAKSNDSAVIWYYNKQTGEYWCGYIILSKLTEERANELRGHVTVLNSDKNIKRLSRVRSNRGRPF